MQRMPNVQLKITLLYPDARLPKVATPDSIGADVYSYIKSDSGRPLKAMIAPGMTRKLHTGIVAVAEPPFSILCCSRSGLAAKGLFVTNAPGVIDPDYRGEIQVLLHNASPDPQWIEHETRIAQLILVPIPVPLVSESDLDLRNLTSLRGDAGFGSTGDK